MNKTQKIFFIIGVMAFSTFAITSIWYVDKPWYEGEFSFFRYVSGYMNNPIEHTNWLGIVGLIFTIGSLLGFFLFKDK
jgi:hypothetical protein